MASKLGFKIFTSDGKKLEDQVDILNVVTTSGALGIMAHHLPLVAILEISHFNYKKDGVTYYFAISGGVLSINNNEATILAESFEAGNEIDFQRAENAKKRAEEILAESKEKNFEYQQAEIALKRAINRLNINK